MAVIEVDHLSKEYRLGQIQGAKQGIKNLLARLRGKPVAERKRFTALDDVHFSVEAGEVVGIIGHNGAGKSTLLKMLAKVSVPTSGSVRVRGRVAPLIEVGAGLVPDMTGRENIFLNGSILGMSRAELEKKFDEIVAFAELEEFIDTPVKRYSSGMKVRLGFAIATSIDAEVLIVDEVLAVGDLAFQRKCFDRMEHLIRNEGKTVLIVSHNIRQVERLCDRVLLMSKGKVVKDGEASDVCTMFYEVSDKRIHENIEVKGVRSSRFESSGDIYLDGVSLFDDRDNEVKAIGYNQSTKVVLRFKVNNKIVNPVFSVGIHTTDFVYIATERSFKRVVLDELNEGMYEIECIVKNMPVLPGVYSLRCSVSSGAIISTIFYADNIFSFRVVSDNLGRSEVASEGLVSFESDWRVTRTELASHKPDFSG